MSLGYLGLGSNVGDRRIHLEAAVAALRGHGIEVLASSSVYETEPVGLVLDQPAGTRRIYRVNPDGLAALRAELERFWGKALAAYKEAVEQTTKEEG